MSLANSFLDFTTALYILLYGTAVSFYFVSLFYKHNFISQPQIEYKASDYYKYEYTEEYDILEERELDDDDRAVH